MSEKAKPQVVECREPGCGLRAAVALVRDPEVSRQVRIALWCVLCVPGILRDVAGGVEDTLGKAKTKVQAEGRA